MEKGIITTKEVQEKVLIVHGQKVLLDRDVAALYGVETKAINQAVKRNIERFPEEFRFQLTKDEYDFLRSQFATLKEDEKVLRSQSVTLENDASDQRGKHAKYLPYVFTEQGVAMLSAVLHSETAIQVSIKIMNAFVQLRHYVSEHVLKTDDKAELVEIRRLLLLHIDHCDKKFSEQDEKINQIIHVLNNLLEEPNSEKKIGFKTIREEK